MGSMIEDMLKKVGRYREKIGAKAQAQENREAAEDNATSKGDKYREERQERIDDEIRERRRKRKEESES